MQASSEMQRDLWIAGIQEEIEQALNKGTEGSAGAATDPSRACSRVTSHMYAHMCAITALFAADVIFVGL